MGEKNISISVSELCKPEHHSEVSFHVQPAVVAFCQC